jgi:hypothetical protein
LNANDAQLIIREHLESSGGDYPDYRQGVIEKLESKIDRLTSIISILMMDSSEKTINLLDMTKVMPYISSDEDGNINTGIMDALNYIMMEDGVDMDALAKSIDMTPDHLKDFLDGDKTPDYETSLKIETFLKSQGDACLHKCSACDGKGLITIIGSKKNKCEHCDGEGYIK